MANYNADTLQEFFDKRDYLGAANYLSGTKAATPQKQIILNRRINQLRRDGEIQAAMLQHMSGPEQEAFHFMSSLKGDGAIPHSIRDENGNIKPGTSNTFGDNYLESLNHITTSDGTLLQTIGVKLNDDTLLENIYARLGVNNAIQAKDKYGLDILRNSNDGAWELSMARDNKQFPMVLNAITSSHLDVTSKYKFTNSANLPVDIYPYKFSYFGSDVKGNRYNEDNIDLTSIRNSSIIYDRAKSVYDAAMERLNRREYDEEMFVTPFLGHGHANAYKRMKQGLISIDDYNKIVEERTKTYNTLLKQADLTQQEEVYVSDMTESSVLKKVDSEQARELNRMLLLAMDKKAVTYSAAMHGGQVGTYITINPMKDEDNAPVKELSHGYRIFVPGLFKSSCDEAFENDTQTLASRDLADMKHWKYGKKLSNGNYIGWDDTIGTYKYVKDANNQQVKLPITQQEALQELNKENIIQKSAEVLMSNLDSNGNPLTQLVKGKLQPYDLETSAKTLAAVGVNELYPKGIYSDGQRLEEHNNIYNHIMELLDSVINKQSTE